MGKKKDKNKKTKAPKEDKVLSQLTTDVAGAKDLYNNNFPTAPLQTYTDPFAQYDQALMGELYAYADPSRDSFAGKIDPNTQAIIDRMRAEADPNSPYYTGGITADQQGYLNSMSSRLQPGSSNYVGNISPEQQSILRSLKDRSDPNSANYAGKYSSDIQDVINRFKGGLEGYSAAENAAFREAGERGLDSTYNNMRYNKLRDLARTRTRGAAASAQMQGLDRDRGMQQAQFEQDLFIKNADEKQRRLGQYGDYVRGVDSDYANRGASALQDYANFQKSAEDTAYGRQDKLFSDLRDYQGKVQNDAFARRDNAFNAFRDYQTSALDTAWGRGRDAMKNYQDALYGGQEKAFNIGQFNIGQAEKTNARDVGTQMGLLGLLGERRQNEKQNKIMGLKEDKEKKK